MGYDDFWTRHGLPQDRLEEFHKWLRAARVSAISGGEASRTAVRLFLEGTSPRDAREILTDGVRYFVAITDEVREVIDKGDRRFPGLCRLLWCGNVIHGEQVLALAPRGRAVFPSDAGDVILWLWGVGAVRPMRFCPTASGGVLLRSSPEYAKAKYRAAPVIDTAPHWSWEVLIDAPQEEEVVS